MRAMIYRRKDFLMNAFLRRTASATAALCLVAPAAWSMTAEEAWDAWVSIASQYGEDIAAASTEKVGDTLTAGGVTVKIEVEDLSISGELGDVTLTENSDGSVTIKTPEAFAIDMVAAPEYGEKVEAQINFATPGLDTQASEVGGITTFTYGAPEIVISVDDMKVDGEDVPFNIMAKLTGTTGTYAVGAGDDAAMTSEMTTEALDISFDGRDPEGGGNAKGTISVAGFSTTSAGQGNVLFMSPEKLPALLRAGAEVSGNSTIGATTFEMSGQDGSDNFAVSGSMDGATLAMQLSGEQVTYAVNYQNFALTMSGSDIPLPEVSLALGETSVNVIFPLEQSDTPKPFMMAVGLKDLTLADGLWNMFDPGTVLPRDPATLTFNLAGQGNWLVDILDEKTMAEGPQGVPGELHALTVSDVLLKVAGAEFTADGAFTFDNSDLTTFDGLPAPDGTLNLKLVGGNALIDKIVSMGYLPADQANMIKLSAGAFTRPGTDPDTLTSEITVTPDGMVSANGIPIPLK